MQVLTGVYRSLSPLTQKRVNILIFFLLAKARFGLAAEMRPKLLALVQKALENEDIELVS